MGPIKVKKLRAGAQLPTYGTEFSAGADLYACLEADVTIAPGETVTAHVRNGWYMAFASCDLTVHYDATMFRLVDARVSGEMEGTVYSLNTATPGLVRLSCATRTGQVACN